MSRLNGMPREVATAAYSQREPRFSTAGGNGSGRGRSGCGWRPATWIQGAPGRLAACGAAALVHQQQRAAQAALNWDSLGDAI